MREWGGRGVKEPGLILELEDSLRFRTASSEMAAALASESARLLRWRLM